MSGEFTEIQLDALRELANIGSGTAGTALSQLLGRPVDISVPKAAALPLDEALDSAGPAGEEAYGVVVPIAGDLDAIVLLLFPVPHATTLCWMLGVDPASDDGRSALGEIGNILGTLYINALCSLTGMALEPSPPQVVDDTPAAIVSSVLAMQAHETDVALILDSNLEVEGEPCSLSFLLLPSIGGVTELLSRIGMA